MAVESATNPIIMKYALLLLISTAITSFTLFAQQTITLVGTMKLIQAGSCNIDNEPSYVKLVLLVDAKTNKITGTEYARDQNNQYTKADHITWTGEVLNDASFRLQEKYSFTCSEVKRTETLHFIGVKDENRIKLTDRFAMCPDMNCIFDIEYDLKIVAN